MPNRLLLACYCVAVLTIALLAAYSVETAEDASIGGGLMLLLVGALGLPWSLAVDALVGTNGAAPWRDGLTLAACALLNGLLVAWWLRRRAR